MSRYPTRKPTRQMAAALRPLAELRQSQEYSDGGLEMAEHAGMLAFAAEVALHSMGGKHKVPRQYRRELYEVVSAQAADIVTTKAGSIYAGEQR
jgi:hypothetical protein